MRGRVVLITGGTGGIGKATATGIAKLGGTVVIAGRSRERGKTVSAEIQAQSGNSSVEWMLADLSSQESIRTLARDFCSRYDRLHVLINNVGGLYANRWETVDGIEATLVMNHLCPFLLTHLLLPLLQDSTPARIVNVSGHKSAKLNFDDLQAEQWYHGFKICNQAKLANFLFTHELAKRLAGTGVTVNAAHPGIARTRLLKQYISEKEYSSKIVSSFLKALLFLLSKHMTTEKAAQSSVYLASSPEVEGVSGKCFSRKKKIVKPRLEDCDEEVVKRLWKISAELTGLTQTEIKPSRPCPASSVQVSEPLM